MKKYLNLNTARGGIIYIQNLVVKNSKQFAIILDESIKNYKNYKETELIDKSDEKWTVEWEIPETHVLPRPSILHAFGTFLPGSAAPGTPAYWSRKYLRPTGTVETSKNQAFPFPG